jgi:hypothetical protein
MPLSTTRLPKASLQLLADKMADRLPSWKGRLMHQSVCLALIKTTPVAIPIYTAISHALPPWLMMVFMKISHSFLWSRTEVVHGVKCLVAWDKVQRSLALSGLGVCDLNLMGRAL